MNKYIEHDKRNHSLRTMSQEDIIMHYGASVVNTLWQDGSVSLSKGIDIYIDDCYSLCSPAEQVRNNLCGVKPVTKC